MKFNEKADAVSRLVQNMHFSGGLEYHTKTVAAWVIGVLLGMGMPVPHIITKKGEVDLCYSSSGAQLGFVVTVSDTTVPGEHIADEVSHVNPYDNEVYYHVDVFDAASAWLDGGGRE